MKLLLLLCSLAQARTVSLPSTHAQTLRDKLTALGPKGGVTMTCDLAGSCAVAWDAEHQAGRAMNTGQDRAERETKLTYLTELRTKLRAGTITPAERDALLELLTGFIVGA